MSVPVPLLRAEPAAPAGLPALVVFAAAFLVVLVVLAINIAGRLLLFRGRPL